VKGEGREKATSHREREFLKGKADLGWLKDPRSRGGGKSNY